MTATFPPYRKFNLEERLMFFVGVAVLAAGTVAEVAGAVRADYQGIDHDDDGAWLALGVTVVCAAAAHNAIRRANERQKRVMAALGLPWDDAEEKPGAGQPPAAVGAKTQAATTANQYDTPRRGGS